MAWATASRKRHARRWWPTTSEKSSDRWAVGRACVRWAATTRHFATTRTVVRSRHLNRHEMRAERGTGASVTSSACGSDEERNGTGCALPLPLCAGLRGTGLWGRAVLRLPASAPTDSNRDERERSGVCEKSARV
jgi:hypothetical protein